MDLVYILRVLWRRRVWVALAVGLAILAAVAATHKIGLSPPSATAKRFSIGGASTEVLVDTPRPALADLASDITGLSTRAEIYSRFVTSGAVTQVIARETGIPASRIVASGPVLQATEAADPTSSERARDILDEGKAYRIQVSPQKNLPLFSIFTQAPTAREAVALADGTATGLDTVVAQTQRESRIPRSRRVKIRQLGTARGSTVEGGADKTLAVLAFVGVLGGACILILVASSVGSAWSRARDGLDGVPVPERRLAPTGGGDQDEVEATADLRRLPAAEGPGRPGARRPPPARRSQSAAEIVGDSLESVVLAAQSAAEQGEQSQPDGTAPEPAPERTPR